MILQHGLNANDVRFNFKLKERMNTFTLKLTIWSAIICRIDYNSLSS